MAGKLAQLKARAKREGWHKWIRTEADEKAVLAGCVFDPAAADRVFRFFGLLRHSKGEWAGQPFEPLPWQRDEVLGPLFGWKRADGTRRFRRAYIEIPKKNGKSTLCSGISLYLLVGDGEKGAEVYTAGTDRNQAGIVYRESAQMVKSSPGLSRHLQVNDTIKRIVYAATASWYQALSADAGRNEGINPHGLVFDELHAQRSREFFETLMWGMAARRQPLMVSITTAGYDRKTICWEEHEYAEKVIAGVIEDPAYFAYIAAAADEDDWTDPKVWAKANPSLGETIKLDSFAEDFKQAVNSPAKENAFRRYRLNQWTEQDVRWLQMAKWDACGEPVDPKALEGRECYAGLDLSSTKDLTALVLVFPGEEGEPDQVLPFCWAPQDGAIERERKDRVPYLMWSRQGHIELTEGDVVDYDVIRRRINELGKVYNIREIALDRWNATQLATQLGGDGFTVVPFGQGFASMSSPTKELEKRILAGRIRHGGHPVLRWCASNVTVETDAAENLKASKDKSTERIDLIVALIMALGRAMVQEGPKESVYADRGLLIL